MRPVTAAEVDFPPLPAGAMRYAVGVTAPSEDRKGWCEVLHVEYGPATPLAAIVTLLDGSGHVRGQQRREPAAAPLSEAELSRARELAISSFPELAAALAGGRAGTLAAVAVTQGAAGAANFGHRLVRLYPAAGGKLLCRPSVLVDLSLGGVVEESQ